MGIKVAQNYYRPQRITQTKENGQDYDNFIEGLVLLVRTSENILSSVVVIEIC